MKTEEVYLKVKEESLLPIAKFYYTIKDNEGVIQLWGGSVNLMFRDNFDENISKMKAEEVKEGFMFWNNSDEGIAFYKSNQEVISKGLTNMVLNSK